MLAGIPDGNLPDTLASIVKASFLEKLEVCVNELCDVLKIFHLSYCYHFPQHCIVSCYYIYYIYIMVISITKGLELVS